MPLLRVWLVAARTARAGGGPREGACCERRLVSGQSGRAGRGLHPPAHSPRAFLPGSENGRAHAAELKQVGAEVTTGVGKLGVVGLLKNGPGPTVLIRTDLDALPVAEETGLPYASKATATDKAGKSVSVMHACGHDIHMTCLVGVARWLASHKDQWAGTALLIGQPAEEMIGGAPGDARRRVVHPLSQTRLCPGVTRCGRPGDGDRRLHFRAGPGGFHGGRRADQGEGGHGASPHSTVDPIVLAALGGPRFSDDREPGDQSDSPGRLDPSVRSTAGRSTISSRTR